MDIPQAYDDDLCISTFLNNSLYEYDDDDDDENFALELQLQEAMVSCFTVIQIGEPSKKDLCEICAETRDESDMYTIQECSYCYCKQCISKHVSIELQKRSTLITCPAGVGCTSLLEIGTCGDIVAADVRTMWNEELCAMRDNGDEQDLVLHHLAKEKAWQRCPNCKFYVDKMDGCLHITFPISLYVSLFE